MIDKQNRFVEEYLIDLNATQAAIRAGYSPRTADKQGFQLLENPRISDKISKAMAKRSRRTGINQDRVVRELAKIALVNPGNIINLKDASVREDATDDDKACIQSVKVKTSESDKGTIVEREIKFQDKTRALELLGKHLGMWNDKLSIELEPVVIANDLKE